MNRILPLFFPIFMLVLLLALLAAVQFSMQKDIDNHAAYHQQLLEKQAQISAQSIENKLYDIRNQMSSIADNYSLVTEINSYGTFDNLPDDLFESLKRFLPEVQDLFLVNENGDQFASEFQITLGNACLKDIEYSMHDLHEGIAEYEPRLHPRPGRVHFDMMFPLEVLNRRLLFFASFDAKMLHEILQDYQLTSHAVYLVNRDSPALIDVSLNGSRGTEQFNRDILLSEQEQEDIEISIKVLGTAWNLIVVKDSSVFDNFAKSRQFDAYIQATIITILWVVIFWIGLRLSSSQKRLIKKLRELSLTDPLTGLGNRRYLVNELQKSVERVKRLDIYSGVLLLDLNSFKPINDQHGHDVGDEVLKHCANRLVATSRTDDVVVRLGGDEFVVLLNGLAKNKQQAQKHLEETVERYHQVLSIPYEFEQLELSCFASIGSNLVDGSIDDLELLIKMADTSMYQQKKQTSH